MEKERGMRWIRIVGAVMLGSVILLSGAGFAADVSPAMGGDSLFIDNGWDVAVTFGGRPTTPAERAEIEQTLLAIYDGWRRLDFDLYMSAWSVNALQIFMDGTRRDYTAIANKRKKDFAAYTRVDVYWEMLDNEIKYENRAYVITRYTMTFYRKDGSHFTESTEELYVMELQGNGRWLIIENYDYINVLE
jgi:ketosteroid isomerase-like protein